MSFDPLDLLCVNTIRTLAIDTVEKAKSGHPGLPLGAAPLAYVLWQRHLTHDPADSVWPDRDRFVLSAGHGSALLYSLLHLYGYDLSIEDLKQFRQWESRTPGHPEAHRTDGVDVTTGPLGQGVGNAVGMAIAERALAHRYGDHALVDHRTYALVSDGDLEEGVGAEAIALAGHLRLGKLIFLYDSNGVTLDGPASLALSEDTGKRFEASGWHVQTVEHGDTDLDAIDRALGAAEAETARPSLIIVRTTIGYGAPHKQGKSAAHGSPLGAEEVAAVKRFLGWDPAKTFFVPDEVRARFRDGTTRGARKRAAWLEAFGRFEQAAPDRAREWKQGSTLELPAGWDQDLPSFVPGKPLATRQASGAALNALAKKVPWILGGDADLSTSTDTKLQDAGDFDGQTGAGRNIHFGVREHAMGTIANGIAAHGGLRPFVATFFCFSDYMRPSVRLAALSRYAVAYVWTHDSVALGEDGPTHQPIEHLASLRAMPGLWVVRPADATETVEAWKVAVQRRDGPVALVLSRQKLPVLDRARLAPASGLARGAYVLEDAEGGQLDVLLIATGSEVHLALEARELLTREGVRARVVSMPCWELFLAQTPEYRESVLPARVTARVSIEAAATFGWSRWTGDRGLALGIDHFGASAPAEVILRELGFTPERVAEAARSVLARAKRAAA